MHCNAGQSHRHPGNPTYTDGGGGVAEAAGVGLLLLLLFFSHGLTVKSTTNKIITSKIMIA
jgi:hypothetical protein